MVNTIAMTKARINLGSLVKKINLEDQHYILEKDGLPVAALIDIDFYEDIVEIYNERINKNIKAANREYRLGKAKSASGLLQKLRKRLKS